MVTFIVGLDFCSAWSQVTAVASRLLGNQGCFYSFLLLFLVYLFISVNPHFICFDQKYISASLVPGPTGLFVNYFLVIFLKKKGGEYLRNMLSSLDVDNSAQRFGPQQDACFSFVCAYLLLSAQFHQQCILKLKPHQLILLRLCEIRKSHHLCATKRQQRIQTQARVVEICVLGTCIAHFSLP